MQKKLPMVRVTPVVHRELFEGVPGGISGATARTAGFLLAGRYVEAGSHRRIHEVHLDRFDLVVETLVDEVGHSAFRKHGIVVARLVQSHAQGGPGSATLHELDPNRRNCGFVLEGFLDHLGGRCRNFKHVPLPWSFFDLTIPNILTYFLRKC